MFEQIFTTIHQIATPDRSGGPTNGKIIIVIPEAALVA